MLGYRDAVVKPLGKTLEGIKGFAGVTVMGDGRMILILDLNTLL
ncbi:MAG: chemotaxis protein CheW [Candidatus Methylomirabilales bacterium]